MEELIKQAFLHVEVIGPHVADGHYDLIGPNGEIILPQVWETMIEPDWSITMHMWPIPEAKPPGPPGGMPGPPPGHHFEHRPNSRGHRQGGHGPRMPPPGPPPSQHRGGPPPPPPGWPGPHGMAPPRPGPPSDRHGPGGPPIIVINPNQGPPKSSSRSKKAEPPKGLMGWMAGKPVKSSSGKGSSRYYYVSLLSWLSLT